MEIVAAILRDDVDVTAIVPILGRVPARFHLDFLRRRGVIARKPIRSPIGQRPKVHAISQRCIVDQRAPVNTETLALLAFQTAYVLTSDRRDSSWK